MAEFRWSRYASAGPGELLVGLDGGGDAVVVRLGTGTTVVATADFFTPVVLHRARWGQPASVRGAARLLR